MPKPNLIRSSTLPYHVNARVIQRRPFPAPLDEVWALVQDLCHTVSVVEGARFHSAVLMSNHFHFLLSTPEGDLGAVMMYIMRELSRNLNQWAGREGHLFGARYHWSLIDCARYYENAWRYVYQNPLRAGICEGVENYRYTTIAGLMGSEPLRIPLAKSCFDEVCPNIHDDVFSSLGWLNTRFSDDAAGAIRKALKRPEFKLPVDRRTRRPFDLEDEFDAA